MVYLPILFFLVLFIGLGVFFGSIWLPTRKKDYDRIAELAQLKQDEVFYDLGSGTGSLLFYLAKKYKIKGIGIEVSPIFYLYSKIKSFFYPNVIIKFGNFFYFNLKGADVIYTFLQPKIYPRLKKKIERGVKDGIRIVLPYWSMPEWKICQTSEKENDFTFYLYKKEEGRL